MKARAPLIALLLLALLVIGVGLQRRSPVANPLPSARAVVLILVPNLSLQEVQSLPYVKGLTGVRYGVLPTRSSTADPTLEDACAALARGSRSPVGPHSHTLGSTLKENGVQAVALDTAGAAFTETVPLSVSDLKSYDSAGPEGGATNPAQLASALEAAVSGKTPALAVATFDDFYRTERNAPISLPRATAEQRRTSASRLDTLLRQLMDSLPSDTALLLVTPLPSTEAAARGERLGPILLWRREGESGLLTSPSTRRTPGLIAASDTAATIAALLGLPPAAQRIGAGRAAIPTPDTVNLSHQADCWAFQVRAQKLLVGIPWLLAGMLLVGVWLQEKRVGQALMLGALSLPLGLFIAPLVVPVRPGFEMLVYLVALIPALVLGGAAVLRPSWSRAILIAICAITFLTLLIDTLLGGPLLGRSPLSYSVVEAARFYGIGNEASGVLLGTATVSLLLLAGASIPTALSAALLLSALTGMPTLGADAGSVAAIFLAFGILGASCTPPKTRRIALISSLILALLCIGGYALWEGGRGAQSRTHVGEAVAAAREEGAGALVTMAVRKLSVNARLLVTSPWAILLYAEAGTLLYFWRRRAPALPANTRTTLHTLLFAAGALFLLNDSGVVAAATCLLPAVPLLLLPER
jgi:hypothetical protein